MMAATPTQFFKEPPPLKSRAADVRFEQIERARLKAVKAYLNNPERIGVEWVNVWQGRSASATKAVMRVMVTQSFRPHRDDDYRWFLIHRKLTIYGLLMPRNEMDWTPEMKETFAAFQAKNARYIKQTEQLAEPIDVELTDQDPDDVIEGLNSQQKSRYKKGMT